MVPARRRNPGRVCWQTRGALAGAHALHASLARRETLRRAGALRLVANLRSHRRRDAGPAPVDRARGQPHRARAHAQSPRSPVQRRHAHELERPARQTHARGNRPRLAGRRAGAPRSGTARLSRRRHRGQRDRPGGRRGVARGGAKLESLRPAAPASGGRAPLRCDRHGADRRAGAAARRRRAHVGRV